MDSKLVALKLVLDELDQPVSIDGIKDRMRIQKAIYLAQVFGADFGYRYNWYLKGPYSPSLAADYYELDEAVDVGDALQGVSLNPEIKQRLQAAKALVESTPENCADQVDWLEALASADYLKRVSRKGDGEIVDLFTRQKPHLNALLAPALDRIKDIPTT